MATPRIVIAGAGVITPIGLSLAETAASARARVARLREIEWRDRRFEPFVAGTVPDEGLPPLAPALAAQGLSRREARLLRLAHAALEEALAPLGGRGDALPLLLGLPEHHTLQPIDAGRFLLRLAQQAPGAIDTGASAAAPRGRAAGLLALRRAAEKLAEGGSPWIVVGGVDSLVDLYVLGLLDDAGRIRNGVTSDGFSPSEGAAFLLLATAETAHARGITPLATLLGTGQGLEAGHLYSDEPYLGEGLAAAFAQLLAESPPPQPIGTVWCSFNGERYWAREFGVARTRQSAAFAPTQTMEHPAECFGDLGAACGPALAALAAHSVHHGWRAEPSLVYASSDRGERGAALLGRCE